MIILSPNTTTTLSPLTANQSWVMFVQSTPSCGIGLIKIEGVRGESIGQRLATIAAENAYETFVIGLLPVEDFAASQNALHQQFAASHKHDDWFDPVPELIAFIQSTSQQALHDLIAQTRPGGVPDDTVDIEMIAQTIGVSVKTVRRLCKAEQIPYFKEGGRYRFVVADVIESLRR
jgi:hypothetical protein